MLYRTLCASSFRIIIAARGSEERHDWSNRLSQCTDLVAVATVFSILFFFKKHDLKKTTNIISEFSDFFCKHEHFQGFFFQNMCKKFWDRARQLTYCMKFSLFCCFHIKQHMNFKLCKIAKHSYYNERKNLQIFLTNINIQNEIFFIQKCYF